MKKIIIIAAFAVLIVIQFFGLKQSTFKTETTGHGLDKIEVTSNRIETIQKPEFSEMQKVFYPNDKIVMFRYFLTEGIDSISIYINDNEVSSDFDIDAGFGDIYIFVNDDKYSFSVKQYNVIDATNLETSTITISSEMKVYFPEEHDYHMTSYSNNELDQDIVFNQNIKVFDYMKSYIIHTSEDGYNTDHELNFDVSIQFNKTN
jgi:hypothetical protein